MQLKVKEFLKKIIVVSIPIVLQQLFLNLASLLDTLMVGQLDDASISGVYIATQIIFVVNLMILGSIEGASVFFSQFFGSKDEKHQRNAFAFKLIASLFVSLVATLILLFFGKNLVSLFLTDALEIKIALDYLNIVSLSLIPFAISVSISSTLRETHKGVAPMVITFIGVVVNFIINYILIFGKFGFSQMGATGAAIGTLVDRLVEAMLLILLVVIAKPSFANDFLKSFKMDKRLFKDMIKKSIPLCLNETLWSLGQTMLVFYFTLCDPIATTVLPIVQTIFNLLFVVLLGLGNGVSIVVGNTIGNNEIEKAQKEAYMSILFTIISCVVLGISLFITSDFIVSLYSGVSVEAKTLASYFIKFNGIYMVINGLNTSLFFLLRAGGKTEVVFIFDSFYGWLISVPVAFIVVQFFEISLQNMYVFVYSLDIIKSVLGIILIISKKWYKNLTLNLKDTMEVHHNEE